MDSIDQAAVSTLALMYGEEEVREYIHPSQLGSGGGDCQVDLW